MGRKKFFEQKALKINLWLIDYLNLERWDCKRWVTNHNQAKSILNWWPKWRQRSKWNTLSLFCSIGKAFYLKTEFEVSKVGECRLRFQSSIFWKQFYFFLFNHYHWIVWQCPWLKSRILESGAESTLTISKHSNFKKERKENKRAMLGTYLFVCCKPSNRSLQRYFRKFFRKFVVTQFGYNHIWFIKKVSKSVSCNNEQKVESGQITVTLIRAIMNI